MKKYEALMNLPFDIKKGETLTEVKKDTLMKSDGTIVPYKPSKETLFFKEIIEASSIFKMEDYVVSKTVIINPDIYDEKLSRRSSITIPAWTPLKVKGSILRHKSLYVLADFNGRVYMILEKNLILYTPYFFINSSGVIHSTTEGRDTLADNYRLKSKNRFKTKELAQVVLNKILAKK